MDIKQFKHIILPIQPKLLRMAVVMLKDVEKAKDIVQDVNLKLWKMRDGIEAYNSIEALGIRITKNLCINLLKAKSSTNIEWNERLPERTHNITPFAQMVQKDDLSKVLQAMESLNEKQRLVVHLRHFEEYSFGEIAAQTGLSINHIQVLLSRARKLLLVHFEKIQNYGTQNND